MQVRDSNEFLEWMDSVLAEFSVKIEKTVCTKLSPEINFCFFF